MLEVIGAGFGRTGTHSLAAALQILGFGPCYQMLELQANPGHTSFWQDALDGQRVNWKGFFGPYKSSVEWPAVTFLSQLLTEFPAAKVILTVRDPEEWFESASETIFEGLELSEFNPDPTKAKQADLARRLILDGAFSGKHRDKRHAMNVFEKHVMYVGQLVPHHQLLEYQIVQGWRPLCAFLSVAEPGMRFPWLNERLEFTSSEPEWAKEIKKKRSAGRKISDDE